MREILFRGKRIDNKEWFEGSLCQYTINTPSKTEKHYKIQEFNYGYSDENYFEQDYMSGFDEEVIPETVGQFTGSTDKNGTKIFEHDIVKNTFEDGNIEYLVVVWNANYCRFELEETNTKQRLELCFREESEVIGNIHDNRLGDFKNGR